MDQSAELRKRHQKYLVPATSHYYDEPIALSHGNGRHVTDLDGRTYLDFFGGILTTSIGHNHPEVTEAVTDQVQKLVHTSTLYPTQPIVDVAETLAEITPGDLQQSFFTTSGTEANETATP